MLKFPSSGDLGQWMVVLVGSVSAITAGQGFAWPLAALPKIQRGEAGFVLTDLEESWMVTVVFIGNIVSPIPAGYLMDRLGRKRSLGVLCLIAIVSWVMILSVHTAEVLYVARFLTGMWSGAVYTILPVYIAEMVEAKNRGVATSLFAVSLYVGCLYMSCTGPYLSYDAFSAVSLVVPLLLLLGILYIPESPYYFFMREEEASARASLLRVREESVVEENMRRIRESVREQTANRGSFIDVIRLPANRKAFFIVFVLGFIQRTSGLSILFTYASVTIPESFVSTDTSVILLVIVWVAAGTVGVNGVDYFGRKTMFVFSCLGAALMMFLISAWYYLRDKTDVDTRSTAWVPLVALMIHGVVYSVGLISVPSLVQGELFAVSVKAKASALSSINMAFMSGVTVKIFYPLRHNFGLYSDYLMCFVSSLLGALFALFFMFETKGKSLEEIQNILESKSRGKQTS